MELAQQVRDEHGNIISFPYRKPGTDDSGARFSIKFPVNSSALRAIKYLSETIGVEAGQSARLSSDAELKGRLDISFISIGGLNNFKTRDALENDGNRFTLFDGESHFVSRTTKRVLIRFERGYDYGLVLKCHPSQFGERTWIVCAGVGEWGTSGAAWYLANQWRRIARQFGNKQFALFVRVRSDQDESAEPVGFATSEEEVEQLAATAELDCTQGQGTRSRPQS